MSDVNQAVRDFDADLQYIFGVLRSRVGLNTAVSVLLVDALKACKQASVEYESLLKATRIMYGVGQ